MRNIFASDAKTVIVALDHGLVEGAIAGLRDPAETINAVIAGGADAILTSYGIASTFADHLGGIGLILRSGSAETAVRIGADAVAVTAFPRSDDAEATLDILGRTIGDAHRWGLPVMGEMVPGGFDSPAALQTAEAIAFSARLGAELGADFIKAPYADRYEQVTAATFRPVVILGGSKGDERDTLANIHDAIAAGAKGVAIGRNVFQAPDPLAMTSAVAAIVHDGASVDDAVAMLGPLSGEGHS